MKLSPDVLTYIQTVKNYLKKNEEARNYFLTGVDEDFFFQHLGEIAQKNLLICPYKIVTCSCIYYIQFTVPTYWFNCIYLHTRTLKD